MSSFCSTIGGFINLSPEVSFVVEDSNETVVGAAVAVLNAKEFRRRLQVGWIESLRKKYPLATDNDTDMVKVISLVFNF